MPGSTVRERCLRADDDLTQGTWEELYQAHSERDAGEVSTTNAAIQQVCHLHLLPGLHAVSLAAAQGCC